ncbi:response regulator [Dyadobacter sediminis]|uniref:Response regulator n=1 Tax=Dyadobacter sediminis TaxID=1493691 RepID=A0A5R9KQJ0_9BACT|nr:response regulator [Dyadobacter sediminis]TLU98356.1 response regulator [Dyadobacter sediminis]GGC14645.1 response regulator [Dyadobacter sediminis]
MSKVSPIIVIEDDEDDQFLIQQVLSELRIDNPVNLFDNGLQAYEYLLTTKDHPLVILCDVNMPVMNGLELRDQIEDNPYLKQKSIPFVFLSTSNDPFLIEKAYSGTIQGFYKKSVSFQQIKANLEVIIRYWKICLHPNNVSGS